MGIFTPCALSLADGRRDKRAVRPGYMRPHTLHKPASNADHDRLTRGVNNHYPIRVGMDIGGFRRYRTRTSALPGDTLRVQPSSAWWMVPG